MQHRIWIQNARIVDPSRQMDGPGDILIHNSRIIPFSPEEARNADETVDAKGNIVTPGLTDFHIHLAHRMTGTGVFPDLMALPNGITAAVDAGSCGSVNMEGFLRTVVASSEITIKAFLNVSPFGVSNDFQNENPNPASWDRHRIEYLFERYPENILGLKIRLGKGFSDGLGLSSLEETRRIADQLGKPICVHLTNPEFPVDEVLALLKKGDILCHCYQKRGGIHTILDENDRVRQAVWDARKRGVLFDSATGRNNYDIGVMRKAFADNFFPDIISTDAVADSVYRHKLFHLLYILSRHLALGMPLADVIAACTFKPARVMGLEGVIGTLAPGAQADIAVFKIREKPMTFPDKFGNEAQGSQLLVPLLTIKAGRIVYEQIDFAFP